MSFLKYRSPYKRLFVPAFVALLIIIILAWLRFVPGGLLGKMDAIGYAVCHRIDARSFQVGTRSMPLCARCSGMHLATLLGLGFQLLYGKRVKMPPLKILIVLGGFAVAFVLDGLNSYLHFFPGAFWLYEPQNWLRLLTGSGLGLGIAAVLYPLINQIFWKEWENKAALENWKTFFTVIGLIALLDLAILSENPIIMYPLAVLSGLAVLVTLSLCYGMLVVMVIKRENSYTRWRATWLPLSVGFAIAITQTFVFDIARFWLTGTWGGFNL